LAKQVAQSVDLVSEPPVLGPLGIALGPCRQHQGAQRGNISGRVSGVATPGIIPRRRCRAILNFKVSQHDAGRLHPDLQSRLHSHRKRRLIPTLAGGRDGLIVRGLIEAGGSCAK